MWVFSAHFFFFFLQHPKSHRSTLFGGIIFQFSHHIWECISKLANLVGGQLIGQRVFISEEQSYQKKAVFILVLMNWNLGTDFICTVELPDPTLVQPLDSISNMSVCFAFMNIFFVSLTDSCNYHLTCKYRCVEKI